LEAISNSVKFEPQNSFKQKAEPVAQTQSSNLSMKEGSLDNEDMW
jgi:hypothetical protein